MRPSTTSGRVNLQLLITLLVLGAVVFGVTRILPAYTDNLDVQQAMASVLIFASTRTDDQLRAELRQKLQNLGSHVEYDGWGNHVVLPGFSFSEQELTIDRDSTPGHIRMEVHYERQVDLHPFPKVLNLKFHEIKEAPLSR